MASIRMCSDIGSVMGSWSKFTKLKQICGKCMRTYLIGYGQSCNILKDLLRFGKKKKKEKKLSTETRNSKIDWFGAGTILFYRLKPYSIFLLGPVQRKKMIIGFYGNCYDFFCQQTSSNKHLTFYDYLSSWDPSFDIFELSQEHYTILTSLIEWIYINSSK